jgi:predicted RNA-binding Zn-ribbon protein involved in translation (DUF1610 family)
MSLFGLEKKKPEKDETAFCSTCRNLVTLKNLRVTVVGVRETVEGDCPSCGKTYIKLHLPTDRYKTTPAKL